ncbi:MAG TPA: 7-cyano-7-deazaguanine synthase QueC [Abditibacteriaceae bacterium]|jgi:7-cyano-7-deazaguanine synthase
MALAIAVVSGGLDSVTLAYWLRSQNYEIDLLAFDYGQRHRRELDFARVCADELQARLDIVDISSLRPILGGSALTDDIAVPHGHYAAPSMAITIVPNRNAIFLTMAYGAAVARNAEAVAVGVHAGDHFIYPDCRAEFIDRFAAMQRAAIEGCGNPNLQLLAPFVDKSKSDIVRLGAELGVPFAHTWSCYEGGEKHCGQCGTCVERREAFALANVPDPTEYSIGFDRTL